MGQCLFLPMLMIGGIAIPMRMLPDWAQHVSRFTPGRYAVGVLDHALLAGKNLSDAWFSLLALVIIGACGTWAALRMPRWDEQSLSGREITTTVTLVLSAWLATGVAAELWRLG